MNIVIIEGRLGKDPDVKRTQNSTVANLSVATSERVKKGDQWEDHTEWHRVVVWGRSAENVEKYLSKGSRVLVKGCLRTRDYEKDGEKKYITEIRADEVTFLDSKPEGGSARDSRREAPARGSERAARGKRDSDRSYLDDDGPDPFEEARR